MMKDQQSLYLRLVLVAMVLLPMITLAKTKPIMTSDLLKNLKKGEPWDKRVLAATKTVMFQQSASGGTDASSISKITLAYFTTSNCSGAKAGSGFYTTPDGTSFAISVGTPFGLIASSAWNVGSTQLSITDMTTIQSIAITLKSTNSNTPQANFSGLSFACVPVTCTAAPEGSCTSASGTQSFMLKTIAAVGDPADGGVIGCQNTTTSPNLFNLVVTASNQSDSQVWGGTGVTNATSRTDGSDNTTKIVNTLGTDYVYAARTCNELSVVGGFTSGWFLPSGGNSTETGTQLNCIYTNSSQLGFSNLLYWSSTESGSDRAWRIRFNDGQKNNDLRTSLRAVRCARNF